MKESPDSMKESTLTPCKKVPGLSFMELKKKLIKNIDFKWKFHKFRGGGLPSFCRNCVSRLKIRTKFLKKQSNAPIPIKIALLEVGDLEHLANCIDIRRILITSNRDISGTNRPILHIDRAFLSDRRALNNAIVTTLGYCHDPWYCNRPFWYCNRTFSGQVNISGCVSGQKVTLSGLWR